MTESRVILIVDDVEQIGRVTSEYLQRLIPGVVCYETTDPREALAWLATRPRVDLILSDQNMGEMDGLAFLGEARALAPSAALALMSAYPDVPAATSELVRRGVHAIVRKPWSWQDFTIFVRELLAFQAAGRARAPLRPLDAARLPLVHGEIAALHASASTHVGAVAGRATAR